MFIQDMANTKIDGVWLTAEWSSKSRPSMVPPAHRPQAGGDISYWHHVEGEIMQTNVQGTVPQTQDGPPETQNQQAQHGDPQMNIHSTPDIVHTVHKPGAGTQAGAIPAQQQGPACSSTVWDVTPQDEAGASPPQLALQHSH